MAKRTVDEEIQAFQEQIKDVKISIFDRPITPKEFYFLLSRYPYLEICDVNYPFIDKDVEPEIITAANGWPIYNYRSVIASGCYELLGLMYGNKNAVEEEEDEGGGNGTIVKQYTDVAYEMIAMAIRNGWSGAEVVSGFYSMQRMAWIAADLSEFSLKGFDPNFEDYAIRNWEKARREGKFYPPKKPIIAPEPRNR